MGGTYWLGPEAKLSGPGDGLNGIQSLLLLGAQTRQVSLARIGQGSQKGSTSEVEKNLAIVIENDRAALVARQGKRPVACSQDTDQVGAGGAQDIVDCGGRGNNTSATVGSDVSGQPGHNITTILRVEGLGMGGAVVSKRKSIKNGASEGLTIGSVEWRWWAPLFLSAKM